MPLECNRYAPNSTRIQIEETMDEEMVRLGLIARRDRNPRGEVERGMEREMKREEERAVEEVEEEEGDPKEDPKEDPAEDPEENSEMNSEGHFVIGNYTCNPYTLLNDIPWISKDFQQHGSNLP